MSIASEITRIDNAKASLKTSLEAKGATVSSDAKIDAYPSILDDIPVALLQDKEVNVSGGTTLIEPDQGYTGLHSVSVTAEGGASGDVVFFYDYDGTLIESYTGAEIQALSALPNAPDHSQDEVPLTFEEWNWTLAEIKAYNTSYPTAYINVGACYHPTDGKTHLYFNITTDKGVKVDIYANGYYYNSSIVDWGDGSASETITGDDLSHTYTSIGEFHCVIDSDMDYIAVGGASSSRRDTRGTLTKAYLSSKITHLQTSAFASCQNLRNITIPNTLTDYNTYIFQYCYCLEAFVFPRNTSITMGMFDACNYIKLISIPSNITSIGNAAFQNCHSLKSITIPSGVTSIGNNAFGSCYSLQSITIPSEVTSLGSYVFGNCSFLESIIVPNSVTSIGQSVFSGCYNLKSITLPNNITYIPNSLFYGCKNLQSVTIPTGVTSIGSNAFYECYSLQLITIPSGVTSIESYAFQNCHSLKSITIPSGVTSIGNAVFDECYSLQSIIIPDDTTIIPDSFLSSCPCLQSITIPSNVTQIKSGAFTADYSLARVIVLPTTPPSIESNSLNKSYVTKVYVPYSSDHSILAAYQSATNWSNFASKMEELPE